MSLVKKRAKHLACEDNIVLPVRMAPSKARVLKSDTIPTASGKWLHLVELETNDPFWSNSKGRFAFYGDELVEWYKPKVGFLAWLNRVFNPLMWFQQ